MDLVITSNDLRAMNKATFDAFVESGQYALSYNGACKQFGRTQIDTLITNKLLKDTSSLMGKKRYLISDIVAAFEAFKKL